MPERVRRLTTVVEGTRFHVVGAPRAPFNDVFHAFVRAPWPVALGGLVAGYLALNALFAAGYLLTGGVANSTGTFEEAFDFSVQTMGTIGYGSMYPATPAANRLVVAESVVGMIVTALATGLVFAKFGRTTARVVFARQVTIAPHDGVPTLFVRVGNERTSALLDVQYRVTMGRTEHSVEGTHFYRSYDLALARSSGASLRAAFTVLHAIDRASPLYGYDAARLARDEVELRVTVSGLDEATLQPVHASFTYDDAHIVLGARPADMLTPLDDGSVEIDLRRFHEIVRVAS